MSTREKRLLSVEILGEKYLKKRRAQSIHTAVEILLKCNICKKNKDRRLETPKGGDNFSCPYFITVTLSRD